MTDTPLAAMSAVAAAQAIRRGDLSSERLVRDCLERIASLEPRVQAWAFLDPVYALTQARAADRAGAQGRPLGPLHGVPVGVKDIFDTADMPTQNGTVLHAGRQPAEDAMAVSLLRAAGAIILGKTVTTELAVYSPGKTTNPRDPRYSPGGSSSGSAAAVAAGMVPLAIGSQTNGSVIRPAAYCGIHGFKPTQGLISRHGALAQSWHLDHVGVFARALQDVALLAGELMVFDPRDSAMRPRARPRLAEVLSQVPPVPPRLAFVESPFWDQAAEDTRAQFAGLTARLDAHVEAVELPPALAEAAAIHRTILEADLARSFAAEYERGAGQLSGMLRAMIERGQRTLAMEYGRAVAALPRLIRELDPIFDRFDAILTPAATSQAPLGLESTGSPIFCTIWTLCGLPAITLPILRGASGLPMGAQVVGRRLDDARLLRTARWLEGAAPPMQC
ncbi:MAG TPA: amidase [Candidatus Methylomirabilis sp.]|nr:amidase [Candidatus Methylomirabilis sp.]